MTRKIIRCINLFLLLIGLCAWGQMAAAQEFTCPISVEVDAPAPVLKSVHAPEWEVSSGNRLLLLDGVGIFSGRPKYRVEQKPEMEKVQNKNVPVWAVNDGYDERGEGYWLSCSYNHEQVLLSQRIPVSAKKCRANYSKDEQGGMLVTLSCQ